jgi:hypothetical protein
MTKNFLCYKEISDVVVVKNNEQNCQPLKDIIMDKKTYSLMLKINEIRIILDDAPETSWPIKLKMKWELCNNGNYSEKGYGVN